MLERYLMSEQVHHKTLQLHEHNHTKKKDETAKNICFHTCTLLNCIWIKMLIGVLKQQTNGLAPDWQIKGCSSKHQCSKKTCHIPAESSEEPRQLKQNKYFKLLKIDLAFDVSLSVFLIEKKRYLSLQIGWFVMAPTIIKPI